MQIVLELILVLSGFLLRESMLRVVRIEGFRQAMSKVSVDDFKQTDHLETNLHWLSWLNISQLELDHLWPICLLTQFIRLLTVRPIAPPDFRLHGRVFIYDCLELRQGWRGGLALVHRKVE